MAPRLRGSASVFDQLKDEEVRTVVFFKAVDDCNVGVVQGSEEFGFSFNALKTVGVGARIMATC